VIRLGALAIWLLGAALALGAGGCLDESEPPVAAHRAFPQFRTEVYPVLLRDCGFAACHGGSQRFFRVLGPGRVRMPNDDGTLPEAFDLPTGKELDLSYALAQSMLDEHDLPHSPLLRKPLAVEAGGAGHFGTDAYGRDVYRTPHDAGYVTLARWVLSGPPMAPTTPATGMEATP
jgi:hypothetical protein